MDKSYGGVIWTNHALERLRERGIKQGDAWATLRRPEQSRRGSKQRSSGDWVFYKTYGAERIEVVAKQNEKKEWIILSVWSRPVQTSGRGRKYHKNDSADKHGLFLKILRKIFLK